ncbi:hypothetical protein [Proteus penneri]|uniref:hypothetical protein n=1 Tax=Proteus penneri TaxID=102862 RepID=UPI00288BCC5D|nr:hypothetical protein [Proteus penneri]
MGNKYLEITLGAGDKFISTVTSPDVTYTGVSISNRHDGKGDIGGEPFHFPTGTTTYDLDTLVVIKSSSIESLKALRRRIDEAIDLMETSNAGN